MKDFSSNHYERAFENWLIDNQIGYTPIDEHKQPAFTNDKVKSFDFLVYPTDKPTIIAEVKGRKFTGTSLEKMTGFECWVTTEDIDGLARWQQILGPAYQAVFIFVYLMENIDVDFSGVDVFDFDMDRYVFFTVKLDDYRLFMKRRSPKWQTVTLPADKFRRCATQISELLH
ncbi:MAG: HYExAFE family protein [Sedimentisphaerales bacterium]|nr:HYExAFE family protein [Sedimentisphaerales bacterium]